VIADIKRVNSSASTSPRTWTLAYTSEDLVPLGSTGSIGAGTWFAALTSAR
jgi:hypothetical protein